MGEFRKNKAELRFQDIELKTIKSLSLEKEFISGFHPYVRGYKAMGYLLKSPEYQPVFFENLINDLTTEEYSKVEKLFCNLSDLVNSESENVSIVVSAQCDFDVENCIFEKVKHIYIVFDNKKKISELFFDELVEKYVHKLRFLFLFDSKNFEIVEKIRKVRVFWSKKMIKYGYSHCIPVASYVKNITEQMYALSAQTDVLLYEYGNQYIDDPTNTLSIENSGILKTIDPFWK